MYRIYKSIDIDFAHIVAGHPGACINLHGHTWKFEVCVQAEELDARGFVCDFKQLKTQVLEPAHELLDHGFALSSALLSDCEGSLRSLGCTVMNTRVVTELNGVARQYDVTPGNEERDRQRLGYKFRPVDSELAGAYQHIVGGMKVAAFPFTPTSERLAEWLYAVAEEFVNRTNDVEFDGLTLLARDEYKPRIKVAWAHIYETLHPVHAVAEFSKF